MYEIEALLPRPVGPAAAPRVLPSAPKNSVQREVLIIVSDPWVRASAAALFAALEVRLRGWLASVLRQRAPTCAVRRPSRCQRARCALATLLAALAGPVLADETAAAGSVSVATAVAERLPAQASAELTAALDAKLHRHPPPVPTASVFQAAMSSPLGFETPLAAFAKRVAYAPPASPPDLLHDLLREWGTQYGVHRACAPAALPPPTDLHHAVTQVKELAAAAVNLQRDAMTRRTRRVLAAEHATLAELLRDTFTGAMRRRERRRLRRFVAKLEAASVASAVCAAATWAQLADPDWLRALRRLLASHPKANASVLHQETTPWGEIVFGGMADGVLRSRTLLFLADLGGNDFHGIDGAVDFLGYPQFVVDFAGDDRYESTAAGGYGAGVGRTAIVVDLAGDDRYRSRGQGHAHALFGVGALLDWVGNDRYDAGHHAQGAAWFGVGLLFDGGGNDRYRVGSLGQGVGLPQGIGVLLDGGGDDRYTALGGPPTNYGTPALADVWAQGVARGLRGIAPGGVGLLADFDGDDRYDAGSFAQGGGYYRGVGQLLDYGSGRDTLFGSRYNAGWGAHGGVGRFFNEAGDDRYATRHIVAAGLAWDYSLAIFHDGAGDDVYRLPGFSFGSAAHHSVGMFVDSAGNDEYHDAKPAQAQTGAPNVAVFVDGDSAQDAAHGAWNDTGGAPSCSHRGRHTLMLLGINGSLPSCSGETAEKPRP